MTTDIDILMDARLEASGKIGDFWELAYERIFERWQKIPRWRFLRRRRARRDVDLVMKLFLIAYQDFKLKAELEWDQHKEKKRGG